MRPTVLWICGLKPNKLGGFERQCIDMARHASELHIKSFFVFEDDPSADVAKLLSLHGAEWATLPEIGALNLTSLPALMHLVRKIDPIIVHLHFCTTFRFFYLLMRLRKIPIISTYHLSGTPGTSTTIRRVAKNLRRRLMSGRRNLFTAVSRSAASKFAADFAIPRDSIAVIYNGTEAQPCQVEPQRRTASVAFVGALIPEKGASVAIEAMKQVCSAVPQATLTLIGTGPELHNLEMLASDLQLEDAIVFMGSRSDVPELLLEFECLVVPSIWTEAFGLVIIEGMASGCVVIASDIGGIPEILTDNHDGLLVPPADADSLAGAMIRVINSPELRARVMKNARNTAKNTFSLQTSTARYWELYERAGNLPLSAVRTEY